MEEANRKEDGERGEERGIGSRRSRSCASHLAVPPVRLQQVSSSLHDRQEGKGRSHRTLSSISGSSPR
eukprot:755723-Hanusia_phi.AAC.5